MIETRYVDIEGMHCAACAARIERVVSKIDGVTDVQVNLSTEKGRITYQKNRTGLSNIINTIDRMGFSAKVTSQTLIASDSAKRQEIRALQWKFIVSALLTLPLALAMFTHFNWDAFMDIPELFVHPLFQFALTFPIQFVIGRPFYEGAWNALKHRSANMDVLVVLSTSTAFFYSHYLTFSAIKSQTSLDAVELFYETSAFIITFVLLGKLLEAKTKLKTTEAIKQLYQLQTKTATLEVNGQERKLPVEHLLPGDVIVLRPGEKVPIDGVVLTGNSMIDESLLTGEGFPVEKTPGEAVYAGTINQHGLLKIKVTKRESETALSQIIRIVEEAQAFKAPIQHIVDKVTEVFVPIVLVIAIVAFAAWYVVFAPGDVHEALEKLIAVLIVACPCALGLATPASIMVGSGRAAQLGILFKEGKYLELLGKNSVIVLDKTGTITKGEPRVTDIYTEQLDERSFLTIVGAVEHASDHPVAKAIVKKAKEHVDSFPHATEVHAIPGYGIRARVNGKQVVITNPRYYNNYGSVPSNIAHKVKKLEQEGKTVMIAMIDSRYAGIIAVADEIKSSSITAIARLKQLGIDVIMLTGDNRRTAVTVADEVGINKQHAEMMPQDKASFIRRLQRAGHQVVMVGDGINDAPALTVADVGIAIGTGSDVAIESGDVTIIKGDINRVVDAMIISKKTMANIKQNLLWAFLYNIVMIPFAMLGLLAPWLAGAAMALSSVSVMVNALRLKRLNIEW